MEVLDEQGFVDSKNADIDALLGVIYAMLARAVLIALLGIWALVRSLASDGLHLDIPTSNLVMVTAIAVLAGVAAAVMPARRAARRDILQALTTA